MSGGLGLQNFYWVGAFRTYDRTGTTAVNSSHFPAYGAAWPSARGRSRKVARCIPVIFDPAQAPCSIRSSPIRLGRHVGKAGNASAPRNLSPRMRLSASVRSEQIVKIGIIGAGHIGGTLARRLRSLLSRAGESPSPGLGNRRDCGCGEGCADERRPPHRHHPGEKHPELAEGFGRQCSRRSDRGRHTGNYYPKQRDGKIAEIEQALPESRWVEQQLGRPVIKAFNNIYAKHLLECGQAPGSSNRIALPVAGDDPKAKRVVMEIVDTWLDPVDAGGLDKSGGSSRERQSTPPTTMPQGSAMLSQPPVASAPSGTAAASHHPTKHFISGSNGASNELFARSRKRA